LDALNMHGIGLGRRSAAKSPGSRFAKKQVARLWVSRMTLRRITVSIFREERLKWGF
jgi:hypothetical protein